MASLRPAIRPRSTFISIWFALDALLGLVPPVYWLLGGPTPILFGLPCSIVYFGGLAIFIVLSIVVAYIDDERRGAFGPAT